MASGLVITAVGVLTVFAFLIVLVAAMTLLRSLVARWPGASGSLDPTASATVAAAVAVIHHRQTSRSGAGSAAGSAAGTAGEGGRS